MIRFKSNEFMKYGIFKIQVRKASQKRIKKVIEDIAQECYDYMSTDEGKDKILNPPGRPPIMEVVWQPRVFAMEIHARVLLYMKHFLESSEVNKKNCN